MRRYILPLFATFVFLALPAAYGEVRCPGGVESLHLRVVQSSLILVSLKINHSGPFDFLVDTGAQVTTIEPSLLAELGLKTRGTTGVSGVATYARAEYTYIDLIEAGTHSVSNTVSVIQELPQFKSADPRIRGILAGNFIEHFDTLIDNDQKIMCLDETGALAAKFKAQHITIAEPPRAIDLPFTRPILISVRVASLRKAPLILRVDSGSNVPVLYAHEFSGRNEAKNQTPALMRFVNGAKQSFAVLPPQEIDLGKQWLKNVSFLIPMSEVGTGSQAREDGVLPTMAFKRVFISCSRNYVSLESWDR